MTPFEYVWILDTVYSILKYIMIVDQISDLNNKWITFVQIKIIFFKAFPNFWSKLATEAKKNKFQHSNLAREQHSQCTRIYYFVFRAPPTGPGPSNWSGPGPKGPPAPPPNKGPDYG